jgi:hypothetical protein
MIDMNASIEEIMNECDIIAMNEFEHSIKNQNAIKNMHDKMSGDHYYAKYYKDHKRDARDVLSGRESETATNSKEYLRSKNASKSGHRNIEKVSSAIKSNHTKRDIGSDALRASVKESSIFDPLFDQI